MCSSHTMVFLLHTHILTIHTPVRFALEAGTELPVRLMLQQSGTNERQYTMTVQLGHGDDEEEEEEGEGEGEGEEVMEEGEGEEEHEVCA